jgi:hypothetical protein
VDSIHKPLVHAKAAPQLDATAVSLESPVSFEVLE